MVQLDLFIVLIIIVKLVIVIAEEICPKLQDYFLPSSYFKPKQQTIYYVHEIYQENEAAPIGNLKNSCSVTNHYKGCGGNTWYLRDFGNGKSYASIFAYNTETGNTIYYQELFAKIHNKFAIFRRKLLKLSYINSEKNEDIQTIDNIPEDILNNEAEPFALIDMNKDMKFLIFMNCNRKVAWIMYHSSVTWYFYKEEVRKKIERIYYFKYEEFQNTSISTVEPIPPLIKNSIFIPIQTHCTNIHALPINVIPQDGEFEWHVIRILPINAESHSDNHPKLCNTINYSSEKCQDIKILMKRSIENPFFIEIVLAHDSEANSTVIYTYIGAQADPLFHIYKAQLYSVYAMKQNQIPEPLTFLLNINDKSASKKFLIIFSDSNMTEYMFIMSCDKKYAYLMIEKRALHKRSMIEEEIKGKLEQSADYTDWNKMIPITVHLSTEDTISILKDLDSNKEKVDEVKAKLLASD